MCRIGKTPTVPFPLGSYMVRPPLPASLTSPVCGKDVRAANCDSMTTTLIYFGAYLLACVGGWFAVACALWFMRWRVLKAKNRPPFIDWIGFFGSATERAVALTLVLKAPPYLPAFIGGWVLLKFAIGWQREKRDDDDEKEVATQSFLAPRAKSFSSRPAIPPEGGAFFSAKTGRPSSLDEHFFGRP